MKRKINVAMLLVVTLMISLLAFTACGNNNSENGDKQVPVYQGMTITKAGSAIKLTSASCYSSGIVLLSSNNGNNGDNGNHYGHYKGDHTDRNDMVDKENPFPENDGGENIEEEIKSSLNVIGSPDEIYYATPNEDIYINIHIDNPDSFEIMSFTLNGKKYSSYMFEDGSDMETIVLKYNVGDASGIVEYTIDAIKYIDGTEIKDVIIDGNKTVMAGIQTENQVAASVMDVDVDTNALLFNVNVKDNNALIEFSKGGIKAVIYDGFSIVYEKDIAIGDNSVIFDGLKTNTLYQYAIVGYYDDLSGAGFGMNILYKDAFYTDSVVLFDNIIVGQDGISFGYLWHEDHQGKAISSLKLYKGDNFVKDLEANITTVNKLLSNTTYKLVAEYPNEDNTESIYLEFTTLAKATPDFTITNTAKGQESLNFSVGVTDTDSVGSISKVELIHGTDVTTLANATTHEILDLLSNNDYTIKVTYTYDLNDGTGNRTIVKELTAKTEAKATPEISVNTLTKTQTSVGFEIAESDIDNVGAVTKIELVHANGTVASENSDAREFTDLLSNNDYTIKVTYTYDLNDGMGEYTVIAEANAKTAAKAKPVIVIGDAEITLYSIRADHNILNEDKTLKSYTLELYNGEYLIANGNNIDFGGLNYYTDYTLKVSCTYDLNDGRGEQTSDTKYKYTTLPYIDVTDCRIVNTSAVSAGDTIFMEVKLDNPLNMAVTSVVINGENYNVTNASTAKKIFVEIVYNGQFAGGDTFLKIDKVNAKIDNTSISIEPQTELADNVFINGNLEVIKIEFVNDDLEKIDYVLGDDPAYILITLNNPTGYNIDKIRILDKEVVDLIKADQNRWYYRFDQYHSDMIQLTTDSISYSNEYIQKTINAKFTTNKLMIITNKTPVYVSTPEDLKNMEELRYYILTNDIDLSGLEWRGGKFYGIFEGNGYSIKNMSFVGTIKDQSASVGLFSNADGFIKNLHIENATLIIQYQPDDSTSTNGIYSGFFAGSGNACFYNCTIDDSSVLNVKYLKYASNWCYTGGFVGYGLSESFINCSNSASVSGESCVGGFVGYIANSDCTFINCINSGTISGKNSVGCFVGMQSTVHPTFLSFNNCINYSTQKFVGYGNNAKIKIKNCYCLSSEGGFENVESCTVSQASTKSFYTETLGWSEDVWDFSELDVENRKYPQLK